MTIYFWLGLGSAVLLLGFIVFAFRQGMRVKPDKDRKVEDWPRITQGGSGG
jgi:hypothetical protein